LTSDPASGALIGAVEGGGTKFFAATGRLVGDGPPVIGDRIRIDTHPDPSRTIAPIAEFLADRSPDVIGIASFGPLDLETGTIRSTPKIGWSGMPIRDALLTGFSDPPPTVIDTDVNAAALAEWTWGAAQGTEVALYMTVGTGIGGGAIVGGHPIHGLGHPEMGHVLVPRHPDDDAPTVCPIHPSCLEGMVSGPALAARAGRPAEDISDTDPLWDLATHYLAHGLADLTLVLSPEVIVLGGGVMQRPGLLGRVGDRLDDSLAGYVATPRVLLPHFGQEAGLVGAFALGVAAAD
jgi:fructokinase